jgi:hypothetical protein
VFLSVSRFLVYPMLPVSLDCPFLIAPSAVSNVYLLRYILNEDDVRDFIDAYLLEIKHHKHEKNPLLTGK